jgi:hypothetical protein
MDRSDLALRARARWARVALLLLLGACKEPTNITLDAPTHYKSGGQGRLGDVTVTVRMVPKRLVQGNEAEIDRVQVETLRGSDHFVMQLDAKNDRAEWGGYAFILGHVDAEQGDIELTVHQR